MKNTIPVGVDNKGLSKLYRKSAYTIVGCGGNLEEWTEGYNKMLEEKGIGTVKHFYRFTGRQVNNYFNLKGENRFDDKLTFLAFYNDGLNIGKLAMFKLAMGDRWFDDLIDNRIEEEGEEES